MIQGREPEFDGTSVKSDVEEGWSSMSHCGKQSTCCEREGNECIREKNDPVKGKNV